MEYKYIYIYIYIYMWLMMVNDNLVGGMFLPLWKIWVRQLGGWNSQYMENKKMFQTTNQEYVHIYIYNNNNYIMTNYGNHIRCINFRLLIDGNVTMGVWLWEYDVYPIIIVFNGNMMGYDMALMRMIGV